jgi:hypothetical protein
MVSGQNAKSLSPSHQHSGSKSGIYPVPCPAQCNRIVGECTHQDVMPKCLRHLAPGHVHYVRRRQCRDGGWLCRLVVVRVFHNFN